MKIMGLLLVGIVFVLCSCSNNNSQKVNYTYTYSQGFNHADNLYFLLDYKVWERGKTYWFILPIESGSKVYHKELSMYKYNVISKILTKLKLLKDSYSGINVKSTKFKLVDSTIVFAYSGGYNKNVGEIIKIYNWDMVKNEITDYNSCSTEDELYQKYFADYKSPWKDNDGIIDITELKQTLKDVKSEQYDLPSNW